MPPEPEQYRTWAGQAAAALQRWYQPATGLWKTAGWWNSANALTAMIQHSQRTGERRYRDVIATTFGRARRVHPGFSNEYYDDDGWWALAWIAAFDLTGEVRYLDLARTLFAGMAAGWDQACGGGLWWTRRNDYKNAIPNELFLLLAGRLHQRTADPGRRGSGYLGWALREWQWFQASGLIGPAGLVNDGLTAGCANNSGTTWTYNQGVITGGLTVLHQITGDRGYLAQAHAIAAAALRDLTVPPGILAEPGEPQAMGRRDDQAQFKGIFIRHLYELYQHNPHTEYRDFILANAASLWRNSRNQHNQIGLAWTGPFDRADPARQGSALDALNAAVGVSSPGTANTTRPGENIIPLPAARLPSGRPGEFSRVKWSELDREESGRQPLAMRCVALNFRSQQIRDRANVFARSQDSDEVRGRHHPF